MQIVIHIPEDVYCDIQAYKTIFSDKIESVSKAIIDGVLLPSGHSRLIDADKALDYFTTNMNWVDEEDNRIDSSAERKAIFKEYFDGVSTIIEADMNREGEDV